jgi:hypothetical protein
MDEAEDGGVPGGGRAHARLGGRGGGERQLQSPPNAGACGQMHGAFGAFGKENNFAGGADGQQTGANNSAKLCQSHFATTPS